MERNFFAKYPSLDNMELKLTNFCHYHLGAFTGFLIGLILFFNLPSLPEMILKLGLSSLFGGGLVKLVRKPDLKTFSIVILSVLVFLISSSFIPPQCLAYQATPDPAKNPFTGEKTSESFDGLRWQRCEHGEHPWYFIELEGEKLENYCESRPDTIACMKNLAEN